MNKPKEYSDITSAAVDIGKILQEGRLKLFLGAGASVAFGMPTWRELLKGICDAHNIKCDDNSPVEAITELIENHKLSSKELNSSVYSILYKKSEQVSASELLDHASLYLAIAGMCAGNTRGRIEHIFTTNYDDNAEQCLRILGWKVDAGDDITREAVIHDVKIDHLNGYLPRKLDSHEFSDKKIVLLNQDFIERHAKYSDDRFIDNWFIAQCVGYKLLTIGVSGDDPLFQSNTTAIHSINKGSSIGYAIVGYDKNSQESDIQLSVHKLKERNLSTVTVEYNKIPEFLIMCCLHAAI